MLYSSARRSALASRDALVAMMSALTRRWTWRSRLSFTLTAVYQFRGSTSMRCKLLLQQRHPLEPLGAVDVGAADDLPEQLPLRRRREGVELGHADVLGGVQRDQPAMLRPAEEAMLGEDLVQQPPLQIDEVGGAQQRHQGVDPSSSRRLSVLGAISVFDGDQRVDRIGVAVQRLARRVGPALVGGRLCLAPLLHSLVGGGDWAGVDGPALVREPAERAHSDVDLVLQDRVAPAKAQPASRDPVGGHRPVDRQPLRGKLRSTRSAAIGEVVAGQAPLVLQLVGDRGQGGGKADELVHPTGPGALGEVGPDPHRGEDRQGQQRQHQGEDELGPDRRGSQHGQGRERSGRPGPAHPIGRHATTSRLLLPTPTPCGTAGRHG